MDREESSRHSRRGTSPPGRVRPRLSRALCLCHLSTQTRAGKGSSNQTEPKALCAPGGDEEEAGPHSLRAQRSVYHRKSRCATRGALALGTTEAGPGPWGCGREAGPALWGARLGLNADNSSCLPDPQAGERKHRGWGLLSQARPEPPVPSGISGPCLRGAMAPCLSLCGRQGARPALSPPRCSRSCVAPAPAHRPAAPARVEPGTLSPRHLPPGPVSVRGEMWRRRVCTFSISCINTKSVLGSRLR